MISRAILRRTKCVYNENDIVLFDVCCHAFCRHETPERSAIVTTAGKSAG